MLWLACSRLSVVGEERKRAREKTTERLCCGIYLHLKLDILSGKSVIGGRKALENRRFIKHLTSGQYSNGFHGDLNKALNKIVTGNKLMADNSKEKRKVIKQQTKDTKTSMTDNIKLAKVNFS